MLQEKIIEASVTLFFKSGIKAVSMDDVARQVGISKRTLYEYFSSKDVLLVACIDELNNRRVARMEEYISKQSTFFDFMIASTMDSLEFFQTVSPDFLNDLKRFKYAGTREKFSKQLEESRKNLHDLIEDGKRNGYIEQEVDSDFISTVMLSSGSANSQLYEYIMSGKSTLRHVILQIVSIFMRGMATPKGLPLINQKLNEITANENAGQKLVDDAV